MTIGEPIDYEHGSSSNNKRNYETDTSQDMEIISNTQFSFNKKITPERKESFKIDQTSAGPVIYRLKFPEILEDKFHSNTEYIIKYHISDHPSSQHVSPKDQIHPHFQNLFDFVDKNDRLN